MGCLRKCAQKNSPVGRKSEKILIRCAFGLAPFRMRAGASVIECVRML